MKAVHSISRILAVATMLLYAHIAAAQDTSGPQFHAEDDRNQFVTVWMNNNHGLTVKVSNGRPWRPMWVVLHVRYFDSAGRELGKRSFRVYCPSPVPTRGGAEKWFHFPSAGMAGATRLVLTTNKDKPWGADGNRDAPRIPIFRGTF